MTVRLATRQGRAVPITVEGPYPSRRRRAFRLRFAVALVLIPFIAGLIVGYLP